MIMQMRSLMARATIGNILWLLSDRVGRLAVSFFVMVWIARYLGPQDFGHLQLSVSLVAFMQFATILGLDQIAVREFAARPDEQGATLGTIIVMRIVGGLVELDDRAGLQLHHLAHGQHAGAQLHSDVDLHIEQNIQISVVHGVGC